jgi:hypothetical protein
MKIIKTTFCSIAAIVALLHVTQSTLKAEQVSSQNEWDFQFQLYALAAWIYGDTEMGYDSKLIGEGSTAPLTVDVGPDDIIKNLDLGAMAHFEAHHYSGWGIWLDYAFMDLGKDNKFIGENAELSSDSGVFQGILEAFATYRTPMKLGYIDYIGGVRWWHNKFDLSLSGRRVHNSWSRTVDWCDPIIGAVWVAPINDSWSFRLRGDIGGFGLASDFTAVVEMGALYDINENWQVDMRLKSLWVDYEEGRTGTAERFTYSTVNYGPVLGITYRF